MKALIERLLAGARLSEAEAELLLRGLTDPERAPAQVGAVLALLRMRGETADEVRGFARAMRDLARPLPVDREANPPMVDLCGTGGDGSGSLNLSTGSALLAAAAGLRMAKHGNRSISSRSGSSDMLAALGIPHQLGPEDAAACLEETGFCFLFAPHYHPAAGAVAPVRRALGVRTVFNILGPLVNPAQPPYQVVGAFSPEAAELMAGALSGLPLRRAFVVHGTPGWDEATPCGPFHCFVVEDGTVTHTEREPTDYGVARCAPGDLAGGDAAYNAEALQAVFDGAADAHREALVLGAALALEVTGVAESPRAAATRARAALDDGSAARLLARLRAFEPSGG